MEFQEEAVVSGRGSGRWMSQQLGFIDVAKTAAELAGGGEDGGEGGGYGGGVAGAVAEVAASGGGERPTAEVAGAGGRARKEGGGFAVCRVVVGMLFKTSCRHPDVVIIVAIILPILIAINTGRPTLKSTHRNERTEGDLVKIVRELFNNKKATYSRKS